MDVDFEKSARKDWAEMWNRSMVWMTLLMAYAVSVPLGAQNKAAPTIRVANTELSWTMPKQVVLDTLKKNVNNLLVPERKDDNSVWWVFDRQANQASARLRFDKQDKLLWVERSWTPTTDRADDFVKVLYNLVSQHGFADCQIKPSHYAEPEGESEEVLLACEGGGIRITHMQADAGNTRISRAVIYEITNRPE
jgi:hypothetical protein